MYKINDYFDTDNVTTFNYTCNSLNKLPETRGHIKITEINPSEKDNRDARNDKLFLRDIGYNIKLKNLSVIPIFPHRLNEIKMIDIKKDVVVSNQDKNKLYHIVFENCDCLAVSKILNKFGGKGKKMIDSMNISSINDIEELFKYQYKIIISVNTFNKIIEYSEISTKKIKINNLEIYSCEPINVNRLFEKSIINKITIYRLRDSHKLATENIKKIMLVYCKNPVDILQKSKFKSVTILNVDLNNLPVMVSPTIKRISIKQFISDAKILERILNWKIKNLKLNLAPEIYINYFKQLSKVNYKIYPTDYYNITSQLENNKLAKNLIVHKKAKPRYPRSFNLYYSDIDIISHL
ncbi:MAG: hypothetical protein ACOCRK_03565 [bacterium]